MYIFPSNRLIVLLLCLVWNSLRIRMPEEVVVPKTAAMTYGREFTGVRATGISISSTVELMAGSGLKFVHATSKGRKGVEGDLEKSRNKVSNSCYHLIIFGLIINHWFIIVIKTRICCERKL